MQASIVDSTKEFLVNTVHIYTIGHVLYVLLFILSTYFLLLIAYCTVRMVEIRKREHEHMHHEIAEYAHHQAEKEKIQKAKEGSSKNERWDNAMIHLASSNPSDWRLAIIEADATLDSMLTLIGLKGENLGEKLKSTDKEKFPSLDSAWEAHIIRNKIAHEGSQFELTEREAKRVMGIYERIFTEFNYI